MAVDGTVLDAHQIQGQTWGFLYPATRPGTQACKLRLVLLIKLVHILITDALMCLQGW